MADGEDIQPLVCDNGTGMVKVSGILIFFVLENLFSLLSSKFCDEFDIEFGL